jgi:ribose-phosphate pyrophosphokinase
VDALVVHALFAPGALRRMRSAGIEHVVSCDTVPHATNRIGVAPLLATALPSGRD